MRMAWMARDSEGMVYGCEGGIHVTNVSYILQLTVLTV